MTKRLTRRQQEILTFIEAEVGRRGIPPTVREVAAHFGFSSPNGAAGHLRALEEKGYLIKAPGISRGVSLTGGGYGLQENEGRAYSLVGEVAAGLPKLAVQSDGEAITLDEAAGARPGDFLLRVKGDSMTGAGINPGDLAIVHPAPEANNGDIVVVMVGEEEATLKRFFRDKGGLVRLVPENPAYEPSVIDPGRTPLTIVGRVAGVIRKY